MAGLNEAEISTMTQRAPGREPPIPVIQDYTPLAERYDASRYVEEVHVGHEARRRRVLTRLFPEHVHLAADIACGTGRGLAILSGVSDKVVGVDGTRAMLAVAREKLGPGAKVAQANAASLPFDDGTFDLITCLNFVHLFGTVEEKAAFVTEMGRVLKPKGILIVEFDNALQGLVVGGFRKYLGKDIGYDWPWQIRRAFRRDMFSLSRIAGANLPFVWRVPVLSRLDNHTHRYPLNYLATRIFVQASRR
jgi:ubiquinone/menaquinone biosynthesis C-methylase UbiE